MVWKSPIARRILRMAVGWFIAHDLEIITMYIRSGRNLAADGMTRWTTHQVGALSGECAMTRATVPGWRWELSGGKVMIIRIPMICSSEIIRPLLMGPRQNRDLICEWRPKRFKAARRLGQMGIGPTYLGFAPAGISCQGYDSIRPHQGIYFCC